MPSIKSNDRMRISPFRRVLRGKNTNNRKIFPIHPGHLRLLFLPERITAMTSIVTRYAGRFHSPSLRTLDVTWGVFGGGRSYPNSFSRFFAGNGGIRAITRACADAV